MRLALNYAFVGVGLAVSSVFLFRNLYPVVSATDAKTSKILLVLVILLHAGFAIAIKILFFAHGSPVSDAGDKPKAEDGAAEAAARMLFRM
jgi:hypothetical protein